MDLISIIVPIYNVANFLCRCIDSIINQTYTKLDIILVDDGSTDNSGSICDNYRLMDCRIRVIHQANSGLSAARNVGIDAAIGNLITFLDGDDWLKIDFISNLQKEYCKTNADIVTTRLVSSIENKDGEIINLMPSDFKSKIYLSKEDALEAILYREVFSTSACGKLYKKSLFNDIRFPRGKIYEDFATLYKLIIKSNMISATNIYGYYYFQRGGSILNSKFSEKDLAFLDFSYELLEYIEKNYPKCKKAAIVRFTETNIELLKKMLKYGYDDCYKRYYNVFYNNIRKYSKYIILNIKAGSYLRLSSLFILVSPNLLLCLIKLRNKLLGKTF